MKQAIKEFRKHLAFGLKKPENWDEHGNPSDVQMFTTRKGREQLRLELHGVAEPQVLPK